MFTDYFGCFAFMIYLHFVEALDFNETSTFATQSSSEATSVTSLPTGDISVPPEISITHLNASLTESRGTEDIESSGEIAGIVIGILAAFGLVIFAVGYIMYKHFLRKGVTSMNFDNPVYRKTTEDQFSLEKNQYLPARSYPPSLEPLTSPGTNEFV